MKGPVRRAQKQSAMHRSPREFIDALRTYLGMRTLTEIEEEAQAREKRSPRARAYLADLATEDKRKKDSASVCNGVEAGDAKIQAPTGARSAVR